MAPRPPATRRTADRKTGLLSFRVHPDLVAELDRIAEACGLKRTVLLERACIHFVNSHHQCGVLDAQGRLMNSALPPPSMSVRWITDPFCRLLRR